MKFKLLVILTILSFSCNSNDEVVIPSTQITVNEYLLTNGLWKKNYFEYVSFNETYGTTNIESDNHNAGLVTLLFKTDKTVIYDTQVFNDIIHGSWFFSDNEQIVSTNLKHEVATSVGHEIREFFKHCKIIKLTENELTLVSDTIYWAAYGSNEETTGKAIRKYYFNH